MSLNQLRVLVVEDPTFGGGRIVRALSDLGVGVAGLAWTAQAAISRLKPDNGIDVAILGLHPEAQGLAIVADMLGAQGTPYIYVVSSATDAAQRDHGAAPVWGPPHGSSTLGDMLRAAMEAQAAATAEPGPKVAPGA